jgi:hypothetical protein
VAVKGFINEMTRVRVLKADRIVEGSEGGVFKIEGDVLKDETTGEGVDGINDPIGIARRGDTATTATRATERTRFIA